MESDIVSENLKDIIADLSDFTIQHIGQNIPIVSLVFKALKSVNAYRDLILMDKVRAFLGELNSMSKKERKRFVDKINDDPIYGQKAGTFILTALDRHDFKKKSIYLAKACKYYEKEYLTKHDFTRIKTVIERMDLASLDNIASIEWGHYNSNRHDDDYSSFIANGLIKEELDIKELGNQIFPSDPYRYHPSLAKALKIQVTSLGELVSYVLSDQVEQLQFKYEMRTQDQIGF